ncbi:MAG: Rne/Rng family ribonuclease, partial [Bacteroidales bacterium]|nr:Rne/Rng family ribonuclease [Bacteroidales bacterium]
EKNSIQFSVGDIYLGKVKKIMPGLNAAFIDVGYEKDAFLHYLDLGPQIRSLIEYTKQAVLGRKVPLKVEDFTLQKDIDKSGRMNSVLNAGHQILVQIAKEPISTKGPRITSDISIAGRFLVLVPFSNRISISQKIKSVDERNRLKRLLQSIKPNNFSVIIRTVAEGQKVAELVNDLNDLLKSWYSITAKLHKAKAPLNIFAEVNRSTSLLRDMLNDSYSNIYVDDQNLTDELKHYIKNIAPEKADIIKHYKGKKHIFEHFGVDLQIKNSFGKKVNIKNGSYLIIEHTEALHVIDVNSGHRTSRDENQEDNAYQTNLEASKEIARQLRLRDMGGIIVIDFIDMTNREHRRLLFERIKEEMKNDKAKHTILPPTRFGLVQITRQRVRPEMEMQTLEKCPACGGTGEVKASIVILDEIETNIKYLLREQNEKQLILKVHPFICAYITKGIFSVRWKWFLKYKKWIAVKPAYSYHFLEYHFFRNMNEEIIL